MKADGDRLSDWIPLRHRQMGMGMALIVVIVFGLELFARWLSVPHRAELLAAQFAAVGAVQPDPAVAVNRAGDLLAIIRSTEEGVGLFVVDLRNQTERLLQQVRDAEHPTRARAARVWGWSPDDSLFAHTWGDERGNYALWLWDQTAEELVARVPLAQGLRTMKWVGSNACVYVDGRTNLVHLVRKGHTWEERAAWPVPPGPGRPALEVLNGETVAVAWIGGTELWQVGLGSGKKEMLYTTTPGNTIDALRYEPAKRAFLISEGTRRSTTSTLMELALTPQGWTRREIGRWPTIRAIEWINGGRGFALHLRQGEINHLWIKPDPLASEVVHFQGGNVVSLFTPSSTEAVYAIASVGSEPPAVWRCGAEDRTRVYSLQQKDDELPSYQPVLVGWAPFNGHNARFELVPPAHFSREKKYPLVIGLAGYTWSPVPHAVCAQALAHAGAYVALSGFTFRDDLRRVSLEHVEHIDAIYNLMTASPNVDSDRVFLFAFSGSTIAVCELLKRHPARFKGVILLHPGQLPEPAPGICGRVLLTAGTDEGWIREQVVRYREALFKVGIPLEVFLHPAGGHIARAQRTMRERAELMVKTVFP